MPELLSTTRVVERRRGEDDTWTYVVHRAIGQPTSDWAALRCGGGIAAPWSTRDRVTCPWCQAGQIEPSWEVLS